MVSEYNISFSLYTKFVPDFAKLSQNLIWVSTSASSSSCSLNSWWRTISVQELYSGQLSPDWSDSFLFQPSQFCGHNFTAVRTCWHVNKTAYFGSYTEVFGSSWRKTDQNCLPWQLYSGFSVRRELTLPTELPYRAVVEKMINC
jgi:hypothetical protein